MKITVITTIFLGFLIYSNQGFCQENAMITKPVLSLQDNQLYIEYSILNSGPNDTFEVWIELTDENGYSIKPNTLTGDYGKDIVAGIDKRIIWHYDKDSMLLDQDVFVEISAKVYTNTESKENIKYHTKAKMVLASTLLPGLGQTKLSSGKPYWIIGIAGYGCVGGSIYLNQKAAITYNNYLQSEVENERDLLISKTKALNSGSKILAYSAVSIWTLNLIWTIVFPDQPSGSALTLKNGSFYVNPIYNYISQVPGISVYYTF